jgi:uncharacterized protein (DUF1697 family)
VTLSLALLRGVNVGGNKPVAMADLRDLLGRMGLRDVQSVLQSGNLLFRGDGKGGARLEQAMAAGAKQRLGLDTEFFVRSAAEWEDMVAENPFREEARRDPARLVAVCLKAAPGGAAVKALQAAVVGREVVRSAGKQVYIFYPDGQGRSKLTNAVIEKHLGTRATARNWNTVLRLAELVRAPGRPGRRAAGRRCSPTRSLPEPVSAAGACGPAAASAWPWVPGRGAPSASRAAGWRCAR